MSAIIISLFGGFMAIALKLSDELVEMAKPHAAAEHRSVPKQIEYWARLGKAVEDNPGLPLQFIKDTLLAAQEAKADMLTPYQFGA
ncbi:ParD-like family protein [Janthinobacterium sp. PC23-8]|uniref:ParD-like family protein n=1 Tax=Janthinobacterium sp. PC23-8 TaxID=2012679 RepID=UPI0020CD08F5|nr:ParD-like family protein [Janthinobacterium sp. PC23-8]